MGRFATSPVCLTCAGIALFLSVVSASAQHLAAQSPQNPEPVVAPVADQDSPVTGSQTDEKKRPAKKKSKHPSFKIGDHITVSPEARVETDFRSATPDIGRDDSSMSWE